MPQFIKHATRKSCIINAHCNSNYKAVFQRKTFPKFLKKFVHYRLKSTFLKSCISLSLCRSNCFSLFIYPVFLMAYPAKALINVLLTLVTCLTFLYGWLKLALKLIWAWSSKEPHKHMERESCLKKCYLISSLYHNV